MWTKLSLLFVYYNFVNEIGKLKLSQFILPLAYLNHNIINGPNI